ncbi:hypothetical protein TNCV_1957111 [Trichonephila clavipes]|nr:hypothetical protein TNCV_1957111 [Trichonephila clavipes]
MKSQLSSKEMRMEILGAYVRGNLKECKTRGVSSLSGKKPFKDGGKAHFQTFAERARSYIQKGWEAFDHPQGILPQNWSGTDPNRAVTCMVLKAADNDRQDTFISTYEDVKSESELQKDIHKHANFDSDWLNDAGVKRFH